MRITTNSIIKRYTSNLNSSYSLLYKYNEQVSSGRKFSKASEDTASAIKAMRVRRDMSRLEIYQTNIKNAQGSLAETESALNDMKDIVDEVVTTVQQGMTGTVNADNRVIIASLLNNLKDQVLKTSNSSYAGKYIFGGTNTEQPPFSLDASGALFYNGANVNTLNTTKEQVYVDLGLGMTIEAGGQVSSGSAFSATFPGNIILGTGVDVGGLPNNIYELIGTVADMFENNDMTQVGDCLDKLQASSSNMMNNITGVGEKSSFLEYLTNRYENKELNYASKQNALESIDSAEAIIDFKSQEMAYQAALQMGTRLIQSSLMDFLR